jgi:hypothetical protein
MARKARINLYIDQLTDSIKDARTGQSLSTDFRRATARDIVKTKQWLFDWHLELSSRREIYKLFLKKHPNVLQGLISFMDRGDHIWVNLAEAAPHNLGKDKRYIGVGGNLFAIAVKISFDKGYKGFVAFEAKTELITHYRKSLGAVQIGRSPRMIIESEAARKLYEKYFTNN